MKLIKRKRERKLKPTNNRSVNEDLIEIFKNYFSFSSFREKLFDMGVPLLISLFLFLLLYLFQPSNNKIIATLIDFNNVSLYVITILVGFNTTSLSLIATANRESLQKLYVAGQESKDRSILKQLITFYAYTIFTGIFILIIGLMFGMFAKNLPDFYTQVGFIPHELARVLLISFAFVYLFSILYNLLLSLRNISILYRFIFFISKKES